MQRAAALSNRSTPNKHAHRRRSHHERKPFLLYVCWFNTCLHRCVCTAQTGASMFVRTRICLYLLADLHRPLRSRIMYTERHQGINGTSSIHNIGFVSQPPQACPPAPRTFRRPFPSSPPPPASAGPRKRQVPAQLCPTAQPHSAGRQRPRGLRRRCNTARTAGLYRRPCYGRGPHSGPVPARIGYRPADAGL